MKIKKLVILACGLACVGLPNSIAQDANYLPPPAVAPPPPSQPSYTDLITQGNALMKAGQFEEATAKANQAIQMDGTNFKGYALRAFILSKQGSPAEAKGFLDLAIARAPADKLDKLNEQLKQIEQVMTKSGIPSAQPPADANAQSDENLARGKFDGMWTGTTHYHKHYDAVLTSDDYEDNQEAIIIDQKYRFFRASGGHIYVDQNNFSFRPDGVAGQIGIYQNSKWSFEVSADQKTANFSASWDEIGATGIILKKDAHVSITGTFEKTDLEPIFSFEGTVVNAKVLPAYDPPWSITVGNQIYHLDDSDNLKFYFGGENILKDGKPANIQDISDGSMVRGDYFKDETTGKLEIIGMNIGKTNPANSTESNQLPPPSVQTQPQAASAPSAN
jgi:hypothetical protein